MTRKLQILRGTTAQNNAYTGAVGELTMDTDRNEVRIHDGQTVGGIKIGDRNMPILTSMFFDHVVNDMSWLRADTFSWQSGDVYKAAYEHLTADLDTNFIENGVTYYAWKSDTQPYLPVLYTSSETPSVSDMAYFYSNGEFREYEPITAVGDGYIEVLFDGIAPVRCSRIYGNIQTDTIGSITITYYLAQDGHKICLPDQESNLVALYEATGVAWCYILDTVNKQFKLPRTKWGFTGLRDSVGGYIAPGLPNIAGKTKSAYGINNSTANSGALKTTIYTGGTSSGIQDGGSGSDGEKIQSSTIEINASDSDPIYGASDTVQPPATQMYLYFYVGDFEQSATEQTAGLNAELFNKKIDLPANKTQADVDFVIASQLPTADNGYTWYRKYKSGWVEQGGRIRVGEITNETRSITLPIEMSDNQYWCILSWMGREGNTGAYSGITKSDNSTPTTLVVQIYLSGVHTMYWQVSGMSAQ